MERKAPEMFDEPRKLLVIYKEKDEISLNQLKKFVDTNDDTENHEIVGTEDGTVKIVSWSEKIWIDNKKAGNTGNLDDKVLFLGDIKGIDKLIPTLDIKFNKHGVSYGFSGKQAAIIVDGKTLISQKNYDAFVEDLKKVCDASSVGDKKHFDFTDGKQNIKKGAKFAVVAVLFGAIGSIAALTTYAFGDAKTIRNQQLLYGVAQLYLNDLDAFMKR